MNLKVKSPNPMIYGMAYILLYPFIKLFFNLKVDRRDYKPMDGSYIILCNHTSYMDFLLIMLAMYPQRLNAVAAQMFFFYKPLHKLLAMMGCIPKNLFDPDPRTIKSIQYVLNRGGKILIFPEGRCSVDGKYMGMHEATGKLIKMFRVPVVSCYVEGAYNCYPMWRRWASYGQIKMTLRNVLTKEQCKSFPVAEINQIINDSLSGVSLPKPTRPLKVFFGMNRAKGLESLLYYCPNCGKEFTLRTKGNYIYCKECGNTAKVNREGRLQTVGSSKIPDTIVKWHKLQINYEKSFLVRDIFPKGIQVTVRSRSKKGSNLMSCGRGVLRLDQFGWHFKGELYGGQVNLFFPIEVVPAIPFIPNGSFHIYDKGVFLAFTPENPKSIIKYVTLGECVYWMYGERVQMVQGRYKRF
ncbi:MAG: 1-acyl-sn-glycerol-3-phosphate acyltransferase [Lachnospiraceae bacterium]|nr:1-acyl-sn-glycerol-3-phosphate acyltransferase [Lachnospiraceae bacterium]